jgi:hypothetical protein
MAASRFGNLQKATALVPLALLSTAWTASLVGVGSSAVTAAAPTLPDGTSVPAEALEDPASYSRPGTIGLGVPRGQGADIVATASASGIPTAAYNAYTRAERVINAADQACHIDWQLIGAIGRVESDHGRYGGNTLGTDGVSRPGIYGIALDGTNDTQEISDTDAGQFDNDQVYDRAVGPMQFIPSTWSVVGVDADGDAQRNPQDIDDAALATAVYLCSGTDDLGTDAGRRKAVHRYNHSLAYVDLVLSIREAYLAGDYTQVPNYVTSAVTFTPDDTYTPPAHHGPKKGGKNTGSTTTGSTAAGGGTSTPPTGEPNNEPTTPPTTPPVEDDPVKVIEKTVEETTKTADQVLTLAQATLKCTTLGYNALLTPTEWNACITKYTTP